MPSGGGMKGGAFYKPLETNIILRNIHTTII